MKKKLIFSCLLFGLLLTGCNGKNSIKPSSIKIDGSIYSIEVGKEAAFSCSIDPTEADNNVAWKIDDNKLAKLTSSGTTCSLEALSVGDVLLTCTSKNYSDIFDERTITLTDPGTILPSSIKINGKDTGFEVGDVYTFTKTVLPENANQNVNWKTNNTSIATITDGGVLTALEAGDVTITCTSNVSSTIFDSKTITISPKSQIEPTSISINQTADVKIEVGSTYKLSATVLPEGANQSVEWSSSDIDVAAIKDDGTITAIKEGKATITCESSVKSEIKTTKEITVIPKQQGGDTPTNVVIDNITKTIALKVNQKYKMTAKVIPETADQTVTWNIPNPYSSEIKKAAEIDKTTGEIIALAPGTAVVTCTCAADNSLTSTKEISVLVTEATGIKLTRTSFDLEVGDQRELYAELSPSKYCEQTKINVTNSDSSVVDYNETTNKFTCLKQGSATLTFSSELNPTLIKKCVINVTDKKPMTSGTTYNPGVYGDYYKVGNEYLTWTDSKDLLTKLNTISRNTYTAIPYGGSPTNWMSNKAADQALDDYLMVDPVYTEEYILKDKTNTEWQREHAFAASLMTGMTTSDATKTLGMATDFHNLFASYSGANSSRGNNNLGIADSPVTKAAGSSSTTKTHEASLIYNNVNILDKGDDSYEYNFEPSNSDKGKLARAIFYMAMMYGEGNGDLKVVEKYTEYSKNVRDENNNPINPKAHGNLSDLLDWSLLSVGRMEYQHNESVYSYKYDGSKCQGNRNPFVDYPQLVDYVFGDYQNEPGRLDKLESSFESLKLENPDQHYNYAIKENTVREFAVGDSLTKSTIDFVDVKNDFSTVASTDYTITSPAENYVFETSDIGSKEITLTCSGGQIIKYTVQVIDAKITNCTYYTHFVSKAEYATDAHDTIVSKSQDSYTWSKDLSWTVTYGVNPIGSVSKDGTGVTIGASTKPLDSLTFEADNISIGDKNKISTIWFKAHTASGKKANLEYFVNGASVYTTEITFQAKSFYFDYKYDLPIATAGSVKIAITGITAAIGIEYIALNLVS